MTNIHKTVKYKVKEFLGDSLLKHLLLTRGIDKESEAFLNPDYDNGIHDPFLMKDMDVAVNRIMEAIDGGVKIVIYSDFDADGIPGAVVFNDFLKKIGYTNFEHYIPHRHKEGFGFHIHAIEELRENYGEIPLLVITIDCGIADIDTVKRACELNIDVIITDHHLPKDILPQAIAVLDPKREDCIYPDKMLCGAGVAYKLIQALIHKDRLNQNKWKINHGWEKWSLDVVGIATLSDMVPLLGENRIFAKFGLYVLRKTKRLGLIKLFRSLKIDQNNLTEDDVLFSITPRINAASRMADPYDAFRLLIADNDADAESAVKHLNNINDERKTIVAHTVKEVNKVIKDRDLLNSPILVVGSPNWKPPLLGLVATNILRDYGKAVFLWGENEEGEIRGSCRGEDHVSVHDIMQEVSNIDPLMFLNYGGHSFSGGYGINKERVHLFPETVNQAYFNLYKDKEETERFVEIDAVLDINRINNETYLILDKLAPFGEANPKPVFILNKTKLKSVKNFGKNGEHFEIVLPNNIKGIKFFDSKMFTWLFEHSQEVDVVFHMEKSFFRNYPEIRLRIIDIRPSQE